MHLTQLEGVLESAWIEEAVFTLRPDYRALLIAVSGITPGPSDDNSEKLLIEAQTIAQRSLEDCAVEELAHIKSWRAAYQAFGAKPQRTRNSVEALTRRAATELPRINRLTDIYNALSVKHQIPIGGEDLEKYSGAPRLIRATGTEVFDTFENGEPVFENPEVGEVVWCDEVGVTCRRWNWRQGKRTALSDETTTALFILDLLDPITNEEIETISSEFCAELSRLGDDVVITERLIQA